MLKFLSVITLILSVMTSSFANEVKVALPVEAKLSVEAKLPVEARLPVEAKLPVEARSYVIGMVGEPHTEQPVEGSILNRELQLSNYYVSQMFSLLEHGYLIRYFASYEDLFRALNNHQIDVALGAYGSKYLTQNLVESKTVFKRLPVSWSREKDFYQHGKSKLGCVDGSAFCDNLEQAEGQNVIKAPNFSTLWQMLKNGSLDAISDSYVNVVYNYNQGSNELGYINILPKMEAEEVKFITTVNNIRLINELNAYIGSPDRNVGKNDVYQSISNLILKRGAGGYEIKYSMPFDSYPFFYLHEGGVPDGYLIDMFTYLEKTTGLKFTFITTEDSTESVSLLDDEVVDVVPMPRGYIDSDQKYQYTDSFFSLDFISLYKEAKESEYSATEAETGVLFSDSLGYRVTKKLLFGEKSKLYNSIDQLLDDLNKSVIKKAYIREGLIGYSLTQQENNQYYVDKNDKVTLDVSMLLHRDDNNLKKLLNLAFSVVEPGEMEHFKSLYTPYSLLYGYDKKTINIVLILAIVLVFLIIYVIWLRYNTLKLRINFQDEAALKQKHDLQFLQNVIDAIPGWITIYDQSRNIVMSNISDSDDECLHLLQDEISISSELQAVLDKGETVRKEIVIENKRVWRCIYKKITHPLSNEQLVLVDIFEVTQDREQERKLLEANEAAQAGIVARQQFLATMSHELRTPIAGMVGLLEILKKHLNTEESRIITSNIIASSRHLHLLVNDILDYSKLEAGKLQLEKRECSLSREMNEILRVHCIAAQQKGLNFRLNWKTENVKIVEMDPLRISQIVNNLLSNAVKFTQDGNIDVIIDAFEDHFEFKVIDTGEGMSEDVIKNIFEPFRQADSSIARRFGGTGLGLSIVKSLVDIIGGEIVVDSKVGVGSTITVTLPYKKIRGFEGQLPQLDIHYHGFNAEIMRWIDVWQKYAKKVENAKRVDIVFDSDVIRQRDELSDNVIVISEKCKDFKRTREGMIELSLNPLFPDLLFDTLRNIEAAQGDEVDRDLDKLEGHILVAEDNAINRMVFKTQLSALGLTCHLVENGQEALTLLMSQPDDFDLLITDCHMPVMDGYELSKNVREYIPSFSQKAVIGCTAEDLRVNQERNNISHFDEILYKPYGVKNLYHVLSQYLMVKEVNKMNFWREQFGEDAPIMASVFVESMAQDIQALKDNSDNTSKLKQIIHKIKGGAAAVAINEIYDIAVAIEHATLIEGVVPKDKLNQLIRCTEMYIEKAQNLIESRD